MQGFRDDLVHRIAAGHQHTKYNWDDRHCLLKNVWLGLHPCPRQEEEARRQSDPIEILVKQGSDHGRRRSAGNASRFVFHDGIARKETLNRTRDSECDDS